MVTLELMTPKKNLLKPADSSPITIPNKDMALGIKPVIGINQLNILAQSNVEAKNYKQALKYYDEILSLLSIYEDFRMFRDDRQPLIDEDKRRIKAKVHLEIAKVYILLHDREHAEKEVKKAAETDPEVFPGSDKQAMELLEK